LSHISHFLWDKIRFLNHNPLLIFLKIFHLIEFVNNNIGLIFVDFLFLSFFYVPGFPGAYQNIFIAGCDIIYGLIGAVVVIFNPSEYREFWQETKRPERH
jgi:hypothetical protein